MAPAGKCHSRSDVARFYWSGIFDFNYKFKNQIKQNFKNMKTKD